MSEDFEVEVVVDMRVTLKKTVNGINGIKEAIDELLFSDLLDLVRKGGLAAELINAKLRSLTVDKREVVM